MMKSWRGQIVRVVEARNAFKFLIPKPQVTRPIGRSDRKWEDTVKIDVKVVMCED
jgi:hypothetical protein